MKENTALENNGHKTVHIAFVVDAIYKSIKPYCFEDILYTARFCFENMTLSSRMIYIAGKLKK